MVWILLVGLPVFFTSTSAHAQIPNSGFENWTTDGDGNINPEGWETSNSNPYVSVDQYTPAYRGNYSMEVKAFDPGFAAVGGVAMLAFPISNRPTQFSACIKSTVLPGDAVYIICSLWQGDSLVSSPLFCSFVMDSTIDQFTCFTFPLAYLSSLIPDSANIMVVAGMSGNTHVGTKIIVDEISFGTATGLSETVVPPTAVLGKNFPNPSIHSTVVPFALTRSSEVTVTLFDSRGRIVTKNYHGLMAKGEHSVRLSIDNVPAGMYYYTVSGDGFALSRKFVVIK